MDFIKAAQKYRDDYKIEDPGGVVIIHQGVAKAWSHDALSEPHRWEPGVIAVDADGRHYIATGGNDYDGATAWKPYGTASCPGENMYFIMMHNGLGGAIPIENDSDGVAFFESEDAARECAENHGACCAFGYEIFCLGEGA